MLANLSCKSFPSIDRIFNSNCYQFVMYMNRPFGEVMFGLISDRLKIYGLNFVFLLSDIIYELFYSTLLYLDGFSSLVGFLRPLNESRSLNNFVARCYH